MPRPLRIEYENAFYHVMNRGRGRGLIFHNDKYFKAFLETLNEVYTRFDCIIHAYCLMGNHYHLLLETPHANLSRVMRHINGVYTQRYNRLKKTDGSLFRGRFKAILVDKDEYIMQLSRYIHRNPIDMKRPLVTKLSEYKWSSYRAYINKEKSPEWLYRDFTYDILAHRQKYKAYKEFTMQDRDEETQEIFSKQYLPSILGSNGFKEWVSEKLLSNKSVEEKARIINPLIPMQVVIDCVAEHYNVDTEKIRKKTLGKQLPFEARKVAMYLCQELCGVYLKEIQRYFNLNHIGSVSFNSSTVRTKRNEDMKFGKTIDRIIALIIKQVF
jgi:REP element-mobilizing transposase RayT